MSTTDASSKKRKTSTLRQKGNNKRQEIKIDRNEGDHLPALTSREERALRRRALKDKIQNNNI